MQKRNRKKGVWFYASRLLICIAIVILLPFLLVYLAVPAYQFEEPKPFYGEHLYNPYQNINPDQWKKFNFHCHSREFLGLTNGRLSKENTIDSVYSVLGYDHAGISNYMSINTHNNDKTDYIPAYEHGYGLIRKTHQLCLGASKVNVIDFPFMQNLEMKQHSLNRLRKTSRFVVPVHASFTNGYRAKDMKYLSNYRLLEILNPYGKAIEHWDVALSNGHRVYAIGNDDSHNVNNPHELCLNMTVVNATLQSDSIYDALERGRSYAVELDNYYHYSLSIDEKAERLKNLPRLTLAKLSGDTLTISTSAKMIDTVRFIGQDGKTLATQTRVDTARYVITDKDTYVRTELVFKQGRHLYLNPVTRHATPVPADRRLDSINKPRTYMTRFIYIVAFMAMAYYLVKRIKNKNTTSDDENSQ